MKMADNFCSAVWVLFGMEDSTVANDEWWSMLVSFVDMAMDRLV